MVGALIYLGGVKLKVHIKMSISSIRKTCKGVGWTATIVFGLSLYSVLFESMSYGTVRLRSEATPVLLKFVYSSVTLCISSYEYKSADLTLLSPNLKQKEIRLLVDVSTPNLLSNINIANAFSLFNKIIGMFMLKCD